MLFFCPKILKFPALKLKFMGKNLSAYCLPPKILLFMMTLVTLSTNRGKNLYGIQLSLRGVGVGGRTLSRTGSG